MFNFLKPTFYFHSVFDIPDDFWQKNGIYGILFDIDNTLEPYATEIPGKNTVDLFIRLKHLGIKTAVISNNHRERVEKFCNMLDTDYYFESLKPKTDNIFAAIEKMGIDKNCAIIIGDQLFTDIWAGGRASIRSVLVDRLSENESTFIKFKRLLEKPFFNKIKKNGYGKYEKKR